MKLQPFNYILVPEQRYQCALAHPMPALKHTAEACARSSSQDDQFLLIMLGVLKGACRAPVTVAKNITAYESRLDDALSSRPPRPSSHAAELEHQNNFADFIRHSDWNEIAIWTHDDPVHLRRRNEYLLEAIRACAQSRVTITAFTGNEHVA